MNFKEWLKPRVLISGVVGLVLASLIVSLLLTKSLASVPCQPTNSTLFIDLPDSPQEFSTALCVGQKVAWRGHKTFTVTFDKNNKCVNAPTYILDEKNCAGPQTTPPTKCSLETPVTQPSVLGIGLCDYLVSGGTKDPRIIIIGK